MHDAPNVDTPTHRVVITVSFTEQQADELLTWLQINHIRLTEQEAPSQQRRRLVNAHELMIRSLREQSCVGRRETHTVTYDPNGNRRYLPVCSNHAEPVPCIYCAEIDSPEG